MSQTPSDKHTPARWLDLMLQIAQAESLRLADPSEPPYMFDGYEAHETVRGGMSLIILGRDPKLDRKVALKLWQTSGPAAEAALIAEAKMLARLSHPNVVTVYGVGKCEDSLYFAMEYVEGQDGHAWMQEPRTWSEIREVFIDAGKGLAAAHDAGIQHRDFKPANMLIGFDGRTRVADFGVADTLRLTSVAELLATETVGTPEYMAPERLRGERGDARSDQFSFCVSLFKAIHGRRPFAGSTPTQLLSAIETEELRVDPSLEVPAWLDRVVCKGLAIDPEQRFADMHELVAALEEGAGEERVLEVAAAGEQRVRLAMLTSVVAVAALAFALTMVTIVLLRDREVGSAEGIEREPTEPLREATREQRGVTPEQVIELIEQGELQRAHDLWEAEAEYREAAEIAIHADTIRVSETYLKEARRLAAEGRIAEAKDAARKAKGFAFVAVRDLARYQQSVDEGTELIAKADDFVDGLRERI